MCNRWRDNVSIEMMSDVRGVGVGGGGGGGRRGGGEGGRGYEG